MTIYSTRSTKEFQYTQSNQTTQKLPAAVSSSSPPVVKLFFILADASSETHKGIVDGKQVHVVQTGDDFFIGCVQNNRVDIGAQKQGICQFFLTQFFAQCRQQ